MLSTSGLLLAAGLFVAANIVANQTLTSERLDLTENRLFSLSSGTENILKQLEEPIQLKFYFSAKLLSGAPAFLNYGTRIRDMLEEYIAKSGGKLELSVIDPEPFSEAEDEAVGYGIKQLPVNAAGDMGYIGLVGVNTTDEEEVIPVFQPNKEESLEYELTKLIYTLAHPKKRVIGVISALPVFGAATDGRPGGGWNIVSLLREVFEVRDLGTEPTEIAQDVDTLLLIHPKNLSDQARYAIDQFVLKGGKAMVFVDPYAEEDTASPDPQNPMVMPQTGSNLPDLMEKWGVKLVADKVAADLDHAIRVAYAGNRGPQEIEYLPWLRLGSAELNQDDFVTSELNTVNLGSAGILERIEGATTEFRPLISTGKRSMPYDREAVLFVRDPAGLLENFKPGDKELVVAARIRGPAKTAFPNGRPKKKDDDPTDPNFVAESKAPINLIVVADTDILADRFWVQFQNFLGMRIPSTIADNADFVINALDNLGGNDDLISLRSRGHYARPFDRVEAIQREAEAQFRDKERALQAKLEETEKKLADLQQQKQGGSKLLLSPEQRQEIERFREEQLKTRKELRAVQHDLKRNIERLGTGLKFINISLIPLMIGIAAIGMPLYRAKRRPLTSPQSQEKISR
ncbi:MAG TPA: Gldg family protein [Gammaproteobacteria bacterium]|nr:Gldg family protein [Gammaproteobacteria bacterium]